MPMFPKNLIYIALPIACHASIAGESLVYFQEAAQAFFCKIPVIGAKFVCGIG